MARLTITNIYVFEMQIRVKAVWMSPFLITITDR